MSLTTKRHILIILVSLILALFLLLLFPRTAGRQNGFGMKTSNLPFFVQVRYPTEASYHDAFVKINASDENGLDGLEITDNVRKLSYDLTWTSAGPHSLRRFIQEFRINEVFKGFKPPDRFLDLTVKLRNSNGRESGVRFTIKLKKTEKEEKEPGSAPKSKRKR